MAYKLENNPLFNSQEEKKPEIAPAQPTEKKKRGRPQKKTLLEVTACKRGLQKSTQGLLLL